MKRILLTFLLLTFIPVFLRSADLNIEYVKVVRHEVCANGGWIEFKVTDAEGEITYYLSDKNLGTVVRTVRLKPDGQHGVNGTYVYLIDDVPQGEYYFSVKDEVYNNTTFYVDPLEPFDPEDPNNRTVITVDYDVVKIDCDILVNDDEKCEPRVVTIKINAGYGDFGLTINKLDDDENFVSVVIDESISVPDTYPAEPIIVLYGIEDAGLYELKIENGCEGVTSTQRFWVTRDNMAHQVKITDFVMEGEPTRTVGETGDCNRFTMTLPTSLWKITGTMAGEDITSAVACEKYLAYSWEYGSSPIQKGSGSNSLPRSITLKYEQGEKLKFSIWSECEVQVFTTEYEVPELTSQLNAYPVAYYKTEECLNEPIEPAGIQVEITTVGVANYTPCDVLPLLFTIEEVNGSESETIEWKKIQSLSMSGNPILHITSIAGTDIKEGVEYIIKVEGQSVKDTIINIRTYEQDDVDLLNGFDYSNMFEYLVSDYFNPVNQCDFDHTTQIYANIKGLSDTEELRIRYPGGVVGYVLKDITDSPANTIAKDTTYITYNTFYNTQIFTSVKVEREYIIEAIFLNPERDASGEVIRYDELCRVESEPFYIQRNMKGFMANAPKQKLVQCLVNAGVYEVTATGWFYNDDDSLKLTNSSLLYRLKAYNKDTDVTEYSEPTLSGNEAFLELTPGTYDIQFVPCINRVYGNCIMNEKEYEVILDKYQPSVFLANKSNFMQCDPISDFKKGKVEIYIIEGSHVEGFYYRERGTQKYEEIKINNLKADETGGILIPVIDLLFSREGQKIEYEFMIDETCDQNVMFFKMYSTEDMPISFYGERNRVDNPTSFPRDYYICEGQENVYLQLEQIGKITSIEWDKSTEVDENGNRIWVTIPGTFLEDDVWGIDNDKLDITPIIFSELPYEPVRTMFRARVRTAACPTIILDPDVMVPQVLRTLPAPVITSDICIHTTGSSFELTANWPEDKLPVYPEYKDISFEYIWYRMETDGNYKLYEVTPENKLSDPPPGIYTVKIKPAYGCDGMESETFVVSLPVMYWTGAKNDYDWNNIDNWIDDEGNSAQTIPRECTVVHIPGGLDNYPSLLVDDENSKPRYGERFDYPAADTIIYHYGSETAHPHLLKYNQAKIQYNWGYYNNGALEDGDNYPATLTERTSVMMARDKWYTLATPLKKMASGDFSLAGYPHTWQALLNLPNPDNNSEILPETSFSVPFAANNVELLTTYNALAVKVAAHGSRIGYNDHRYLNGLKGILEYPYFENKTIGPYRPLHRYSELTGTSRFYSYNYETLQILNTNIGELKRGNESYRFVFETEQNQAANITVDGASIKGYSLKVKLNAGGTTQMLIGNPFMATINMGKFYLANDDILEDGFSVYEAGSFNSYNYSASNHVAPFESFIIRLKGGNDNYTLLFPLEGDCALTGKSYIRKGKSESFALRVKASLKNEGDSGAKAILGTTFHPDYTQAVSLSKMIVTDQPETPEAFFIDPDGKGLHALQVIDRNISSIGLGIKTSNLEEELKLEFENVYYFQMNNLLYPVLEDKEKGIFQDLRNHDTYYFTQRHVTSENQYADKDRFVIHLVDSPTAIDQLKSDDLRVFCSRKQIVVEANELIDRVHIYDTSGRKLSDSGKLSAHSTIYQKYAPWQTGVYIVEVFLQSGAVQSRTVLLR